MSKSNRQAEATFKVLRVLSPGTLEMCWPEPESKITE